MASEQYAYAVARIRAKEVGLLNQNFFEQLLGCNQVEDCIRMLKDRGWGSRDDETINQLLQIEREKTWELLKKLTQNNPVLEIFSNQADYHNLKAALKVAYMHQTGQEIYLKSGSIPFQDIEKAAKEHNFTQLPEWIRNIGESAYTILFQSGDSGMSDALIDKETLSRMLKLGINSNNTVIMQYTEMKVALCNIQIVRRGYLAGKGKKFLEKVVVPCQSLDVNTLVDTAISEEHFYSYLNATPYANCIEALKISLSAFEKWCDDQIIKSVQKEKYNPFTLSPLIAYALARENEIKSVSILLHSKQNGVSENRIRERLRKLYV